MDCGICLDDIAGEDGVTICSDDRHQFHRRCLQRYLYNFLDENYQIGQQVRTPAPTCPYCRAPAERLKLQTNAFFREVSSGYMRSKGYIRTDAGRYRQDQGAIGNFVGENPNAAMICFIMFLFILIYGAVEVSKMYEGGWRPGGR